jgi:hypothetical protein
MLTTTPASVSASASVSVSASASASASASVYVSVLTMPQQQYQSLNIAKLEKHLYAALLSKLHNEITAELKKQMQPATPTAVEAYTDLCNIIKARYISAMHSEFKHMKTQHKQANTTADTTDTTDTAYTLT